MKQILATALLLAFPAMARSGELPVAGKTRVAYSVNLTHFRARPTKQSDSPLLGRRIPGTGRVLSEWRLVKIDEHVYELSGTVRDDNAFFPKKGAAVLIGNISANDILHLVAKTDATGRFSVRLDNRTFAQRKQAIEKAGGTLIRMDGGHPEDQEMLYRRNKYLYLGESNVDLYRYEIPYNDAEEPDREATSKPAPDLGSPSEESDP